MSRFVDATATQRVDLGACQCPGTPHEGDWADVRARLSGIEVGRFVGAGRDEVAEVAASLILGWNLLDDAGKAVAVNAESVAALDALTMTALSNAITRLVTSSLSVPKGSGAPSRSSSRASASPTRSTRRRR